MAKGPVTISGAQKGGTVTVSTLAGLTTTLDPSELYYTDADSYMSGLVTRSLTQYKYNPTTKQMVLVPDLATDLGKHNDDFTQWQFTIRPGVKYENGKTVTAKDVAFGMTRCMDVATFPTGPCQVYSNVYYKGGSTYKGMYTDPGSKFKGITVKRQHGHDQHGPPLPGHAVLGCLPGQRPHPERQGFGPEDLQEPPALDRSLHVQELQPRQEPGAREEPLLGPSDRPGSHPVPRRVRLQVAGAARRRPTRSCSPTPAPARPL